MERTDYVAVLPDETEYFFTEIGTHSLRSVAENAIGQAGLTSNRKEPKTIAVKLFSLKIKGGQLVRTRLTDQNIMPPLEEMNAHEYDEEMDKAVAVLPSEFRDFVRSYAYEEGHSLGYEEIVHIAEDLSAKLAPLVNDYTKRIIQ